MRQSRKASFIENIVHRGVGFCVMTLANWTVLPWFGFEASLQQSTTLTAIFVGISMTYGYFIRRLFEDLRVKGILP